MTHRLLTEFTAAIRNNPFLGEIELGSVAERSKKFDEALTQLDAPAGKPKQIARRGGGIGLASPKKSRNSRLNPEYR